MMVTCLVNLKKLNACQAAEKNKISVTRVVKSPFWAGGFGEGVHRKELNICFRNIPRLLYCISCILCSCTVGAYHIVTNRKTMHVALGFMLGRAFYFYVVEFTGEVVLPLIEALFRSGEFNVKLYTSFITLTTPVNYTVIDGVTTVEEARTAGCTIFAHLKIVKDFLSFGL